MKIKCEICGIEGQLQHLSENYYRIKHYLGSVDGKLKFEYHKQSLAYIQSIPDAPNHVREIDPIDPRIIDLKLNDSNLFLRNMAGEVGFEPTTPNLGGWCSIRDPYENTQHP